jgi:hypothetical protein
MAQKDMLRRYGAEALADAVAKVCYAGITVGKFPRA